MGTPPGKLSVDLAKCHKWFDPVAQGQRLRRELLALPDLPTDLPDPGVPMTIRVSHSKRLITPEGRCALELLRELPSDRTVHDLDDYKVHAYDLTLASLYRTWSRHRLQAVVDLMAGTTKPLQIPAAGVVIALLVNRCTSERRALTRFASGPAQKLVNEAFFSSVQAFADLLAPSRRGNKTDPRLVSGWMLYEARRRLGDGLVVVEARGRDGKVWIRPDREQSVIDLVARDLARGHRARVTPVQFGYAFDALVLGLRSKLPSLATFVLVHEQPTNTRRLRARLVSSLTASLNTTE